MVMNIVGMLLTGTLNTLCTKIQFTMSSVGVDGHPEVFHKPWYATANMLFGMGLVGVCDFFYRRCCTTRKQPSTTPLPIDAPLMGSNAPMDKQMSYGRKVMLVSVPAAFDIVATGLCAIGMLYIPASVWQMLRGSAVVFSAVLSVIFLKRRLWSFNYIGLTLCVVGVTIVGLANVWGEEAAGEDDEEGGASNVAGMLFGMWLVVAGQVVQAGQVVAEEFLMKEVDLPAMEIVGYEGLWGVLMMVIIVYPLLWVIPGDDHGHVEDPFDTFALLKNNMHLLAVVMTFLFSCATFNATGIAVTSSLSSIHRMMLDLSRTVMIWAFGLFVHYYYDPTSAFGESWTPYSHLQLVGFAILVLGQSIYGEVLKVPGLTYPKSEPAMFVSSPAAALMLASPLPRAKEQ